MRGKGTAVWSLASVLALGAPAGAATLSWNVVGGTPGGGGYTLVTNQFVTLELIADLGLNEPIADYAHIRADAFGTFMFSLSSSSDVILTSQVDGTTEPWPRSGATGTCQALTCTVIDQLNPGVLVSDPLPVDPFHGVIATLQANLFEGTVVARGAEFFGAPDASVRLLLVPEPATSGLFGLGLLTLAIARRR